MSADGSSASSANGSSAGEPTVVAGLSRDLGLVSALAIGTGTMIAAGIFTLSGLAVGYVGSAAIVSFLLAAVVAAFTALTYCEFTSIYPSSGEGYLYARKTFPPLLAYLVGWCILLGYASSCAFYIASLSTYFNEFIWHAPLVALPGLVFLAALTLLNMKGTKESGTFQIVVTVAKIALLVWFVAGGLGGFSAASITERFSTDLPLIASTAALVFITFFGFSAIAASAGEVMNPTKTIPRAIFISMLVVTVLYALVVLVVVVADLTEYTEAAMGVAARAFLGPIGGAVIVGGAIFSMISASNASILAGSRVALSMSHRSHLPRFFGRIGARTHTPYVAVLAAGGAIGIFALLLPLEDLAHFANLVLLLALCFVNAALIVHRRRFPDIERPFRVPLVPAPARAGHRGQHLPDPADPDPGTPAAGAPRHPRAAGGALLVRGLARHPLRSPRRRGARLAHRRPAGIPARSPLPHPASGLQSPHGRSPCCGWPPPWPGTRDGEVTLLRVVQVPDQLPPEMARSAIEGEEEILERLQALEGEVGVPITTEVRVGHNVGRAILESAHEDRSHLIVLGWKGFTTTARKILGEVTDDVVRLARADILLVKFGPEPAVPRRILLPSAGGVHARKAQSYAVGLTAPAGLASPDSPAAPDSPPAPDGGLLTLASFVPPGSPDGRRTEQEERLAEERTELPASAAVDTRILTGAGVAESILGAADEFDAVMVGASEDSFSNRILFGTIPERIAREAPGAVMVLKSHERVKAFLGRVAAD